jgi:hypothetical protein
VIAHCPRTPIPCSFVYANGNACTGHVVCIEAYKADIAWSADAEGAGTSTSSRGPARGYAAKQDRACSSTLRFEQCSLNYRDAPMLMSSDGAS